MFVFTPFSLSYIPSYVHVRPGYREKSADLQGTLKVHKISRSYSPCNENLHAHFLCLHAGYLQMYQCLKGNLRETYAAHLRVYTRTTGCKRGFTHCEQPAEII